MAKIRSDRCANEKARWVQAEQAFDDAVAQRDAADVALAAAQADAADAQEAAAIAGDAVTEAYQAFVDCQVGG